MASISLPRLGLEPSNFGFEVHPANHYTILSRYHYYPIVATEKILKENQK